MRLLKHAGHKHWAAFDVLWTNPCTIPSAESNFGAMMSKYCASPALYRRKTAYAT